MEELDLQHTSGTGFLAALLKDVWTGPWGGYGRAGGADASWEGIWASLGTASTHLLSSQEASVNSMTGEPAPYPMDAYPPCLCNMAEVSGEEWTIVYKRMLHGGPELDG